MRLLGAEAGGDEHGHAATLSDGRVSVLHGSRSYVLADADGQVPETHSISAGLDYPGVGPEHALLKDAAAPSTRRSTDAQALEAFHRCATRGHHPGARVVARAVAGARPARGGPAIVLVGLSGRGDKDVDTVDGIEGGGEAATPALSIYLMAADDTADLAEAAVRAGATAFEIGIPYSDPLADGPTVQRAGQRALAAE